MVWDSELSFPLLGIVDPDAPRGLFFIICESFLGTVESFSVAVSMSFPSLQLVATQGYRAQSTLLFKH